MLTIPIKSLQEAKTGEGCVGDRVGWGHDTRERDKRKAIASAPKKTAPKLKGEEGSECCGLERYYGIAASLY